MGVKIKMVTGDALAIAQETAKKLNMGTNILDAIRLGDSKQKETNSVTESIEKADGFAQVFPEHKFHIVDVLQRLGHIVGMTGDGVNDAPALKKADCGIAVSDATDAARAAAAIVLMTPGLSVIIDAIKESPRIFQRMNSYAIYRIAETLRVLFFMTPLGWGWAGVVWGYALVWFLFNDRVTTRLQPTLHMHVRLEFKRTIAGTLSTDELLTNTKFIPNAPCRLPFVDGKTILFNENMGYLLQSATELLSYTEIPENIPKDLIICNFSGNLSKVMDGLPDIYRN